MSRIKTVKSFPYCLNFVILLLILFNSSSFAFLKISFCTVKSSLLSDLNFQSESWQIVFDQNIIHSLFEEFYTV